MEITNQQKQVLLSGLLGDGSIKKSHVSYNCMYKEYMQFKRSLLGNLAKSEVIESDNLGYKKGSKIYSFSGKLNHYADSLVYNDLSESIKDLDEMGLALWIYDDGSLHKKNFFYNINTHSFPKEVQEEVLIPALNKFGIYPKILTEAKPDGRLFYYLYISKWNGAMKISRLLRNYPLECYKYKLIPKEIENAYFELDLKLFHNLKDERVRTSYFLKQNNAKSFMDLVTNNVKGRKFKTYEELDSLWKNEFPNTKIIFEMYGEDEKAGCIVPEVNFLDENPIVKGSFKLSFYTWKHDGLFTIEGRSLTWKMLLSILDEHTDEAHIFLEAIDIKNNNEIFVFLGS